MSQVINTITYNRSTTTTTPTALELELTAVAQSVTTPSPSQRVISDLFLTFNPANEAKVYTFTLTATSPAANDSVTASITIGTVTQYYSVVAQTGDTKLDIQQRLTNAIDSDPAVVAVLTPATNTITVTSAIPGRDFMLAVATVGTSITVSTPVIATPNAGTVNHGLIAKLTATPTAVNTNNGGAIDITVLIEWFDGAQPTPVKVGQNLYQLNRHPRSISALQAANGVL